MKKISIITLSFLAILFLSSCEDKKISTTTTQNSTISTTNISTSNEINVNKDELLMPPSTPKL
jgi:hypothetical protein